MDYEATDYEKGVFIDWSTVKATPVADIRAMADRVAAEALRWPETKTWRARLDGGPSDGAGLIATVPIAESFRVEAFAEGPWPIYRRTDEVRDGLPVYRFAGYEDEASAETWRDRPPLL